MNKINKYIIGPSHLCNCFIEPVKDKIKSGELFRNCELDAYIGLPNWSSIIKQKILEKQKTHNVIWLVSDYKFNNFDFHKIIELQQKGELFLDTIGFSGNIDIQFMHNDVVNVLGNHTCNIIDYIISICPDIKLIFWCLYKRTRVNRSSYPRELWYDVMIKKYSSNVIDIDNYITPVEFQKIILDESGHPNPNGLKFLSNIISL